MNVIIILLLALIAYVFGYFVYARYISRTLGVDDARATPAYTQSDKRDYVPARPVVLFSHHFATIAGAGPIIGPTIAIVYGFAPALLWVILGGVFLGAVHDYTSLFVSLRQKGCSIAEVTGQTTGGLGFFLYIAFTIMLIVLVTAAFLNLSVQALTSFYPASAFQLSGMEALPIHTFVADGVTQVRIGGIATMSVIIMTAFAPVLGWMLFKKRIHSLPAALIAIAVAVGSVWFGMYFPVSFGTMSADSIRLVWMLCLTVYVFFAAAIPVWMILQPRDFVNAFILYTGIALLVIATIGAGLGGVTTATMPAWNVAEGTKYLGLIWPILFITIACGAISGFHSLVAGGTTSKQCDRERNAVKIGYGGMLLESLLAVLVIIALVAGLGQIKFMQVAYPAGGGGNFVLAFAMSMGGLLQKGIGIPLYLGTIFGILMLEGFLITTLDSAVRLNRYLFEELWKYIFRGKIPKLLRSPNFNALISVALMFLLAFSNGVKAIWPLFGAANQMMAGLTLIAVSLWLLYRARPAWYTIYPAVFMIVTTVASIGITTWSNLVRLFERFTYPTLTLVLFGVILLLFSLGVVWLGIVKAIEFRSGPGAAGGISNGSRISA